jgi:hypothetical protein
LKKRAAFSCLPQFSRPPPFTDLCAAIVTFFHSSTSVFWSLTV